MPEVIRVDVAGGPEVLQKRTVPSVALKEGELRVEIKAIGVNRADVLMRKGAYHGAKLPLIPGLEASGVVSESRSSVKVGTRVLIFHSTGNLYASEAIVTPKDVVTLPGVMSFVDAASVAVNWLTSWYAIRSLLRLKAGETMLVCAAASGVGQSAVQIAKELGATVVAAASSDEKLEIAKKNGADRVVRYESLKDLERVETVLDIVGGPFFTQGLKLLQPFGRLVALANVTLEDSVMNTRDFYPKNASIFGFQLGGLMASGRWNAAEDLEVILGKFAAGKFHSYVSHVVPFDEAARAHRLLEARETTGKIVIERGS